MSIRGQKEVRAVHNPMLHLEDGDEEVEENSTVVQPHYRSAGEDLGIENSDDDLDLLADRAAAKAAKDKTARNDDVDLSGDFLSFGGGASREPDDDPYASGNDSIASNEEGTDYDQYKRKRRLDRHFAGFDKKVRRADHDGSESDAGDVSSRGSSVGSSVDYRDEVVKTTHWMPEQQERNSFRGAVFEQYSSPHNAQQADLTLMSITRPISIRGPCTVFGITGESAVGGVYLGRGAVHVGPMDKCAVHPAPKLNIKNRKGIETELESPYGSINWVWVETRVKEWRGRCAGSMPVLILVAYEKQPQETLKFGQENQKPKKSLPVFFNKFIVPGIETGLLPTVIPSMLKGSGTSVAVVGCQNIGKSTHCRYLANALFSIHGECLWLDLDLGQPEFGVSGSVSLSRIKKPLLHSNAHDCAEVLKSYFVGSSRVRCPVFMSNVLAQISRDTVLLKGNTPLVINTHGWIHSTGRRSTLEVLRRVQPKHIVHLLLHPSYSNDEDATSPWLNAALIADAPSGLNSTIVPKRFQLPFACPLQPANTTNKETDDDSSPAKRKKMENNAAYELNIHGVTVDRELVSKGAHHSRRRTWARYFGINQREEEAAGLGAITVQLESVSVSTVGGVPTGQEGLAAALSKSVVALCTEESGGVGSSSSASSTTPKSAVAFGLVVSDEASIAASGEVLISTPSEVDPSTVRGLVLSLDRADTEWIAAYGKQLSAKRV